MIDNRSDCFDVAGSHVIDEVKGHGRNFMSLVHAGKWKISGFRYGHSKCQCCGRPISRLLMLKNEAHDVVSHDKGYIFPEVIAIGVVCGPKVFAEAARKFYDDPDAEWVRQHSIWKEFIKYTILCQSAFRTWNTVPTVISSAVDAFIQTAWDVESCRQTSDLCRIKDAKRRVLQTSTDMNKRPVNWMFKQRLNTLLKLSYKTGIVQDDLTVESIDSEGNVVLTGSVK